MMNVELLAFASAAALCPEIHCTGHTLYNNILVVKWKSISRWYHSQAPEFNPSCWQGPSCSFVEICCGVIWCVFTFWVPCTLRFPHKAMFGSSLPPVVCRKEEQDGPCQQEGLNSGACEWCLLLIWHPLCFSYIQSSPVKVMAVTVERKHLRKM
jgi:hypothetical protein